MKRSFKKWQAEKGALNEDTVLRSKNILNTMGLNLILYPKLSVKQTTEHI